VHSICQQLAPPPSLHNARVVAQGESVGSKVCCDQNSVCVDVRTICSSGQRHTKRPDPFVQERSRFQIEFPHDPYLTIESGSVSNVVGLPMESLEKALGWMTKVGSA